MFGNEMANEFRIKNGVAIGTVPIINSDGEWIGPNPDREYVRVTSNYTAKNRDKIIADTSNGTFTVNLPLNPQTGYYVKIVDGGDFEFINLTVGRNGQPIEGVNDDILLDIKNVIVEFIYDVDSWQVTSTAGSNVVRQSTTTGILTKYPTTISVPIASEHEGEMVYVAENGKIYWSDGTNWNRVATDGTL